MLELYPIILALILVLIVGIYYIDSYVKWRNVAKSINKLPGPKTVPFVGTVYTLWGPREDAVERENEQHTKYGRLYRTWLGSYPVVNALKAEYVETILKDTQNITKGPGVEFNRPWLGENVLFSTGNLWKSRRKLLTPAFHFKILDDFNKTFIEKAEILAKKLEEKSKCGDYFDVFMTIKLCGLDIICKTAMGIELNAMNDSNKKYVKSIEKVTELTFKRIIYPWLHYDFIFKLSKIGKEYFETVKYLHEFTRNVVKEKKLQYKSKPKVEPSEKDDMGTKKRLALLDLLLESSDNENINLTDEDIQNEVDTFMFGGHDTTTVATSWCLFLVGNYPDVQEKIHEELDSIFQDDRPISPDDLKEMKYLEMCIKESLRLYPSAPIITRKITNPITVGGYEIPVGSLFRILIHQIHRDPDHFPEPDRFNPDNFLPENCSKRHPFAFIPFSAGLRNCIGQKFAQLEEKILLATIFRKFKITSKIKPEQMKVFHEMILRPQGGIEIKFEPR